MKKKLLCILHIPPPVTGAGMVGKFIKESKIINETFCADYLNLSSSFSLERIGQGGVGKIFAILKIYFKTIRLLLINSYDLCYMTLTASGPGFYKDFLLVLILKIFNKKIIYHFHNKGVRENSGNAFNRMLYRSVFHNARSILLSPELYSDIAAYANREEVYFCPNGIPDVAPVNREVSDKASVCRFFFLSNMMEEKGVYLLLNACKFLKDNVVAFECHFVGAWSDVSEIQFRQRVDQLGINEYIFAHGKKYGIEKRDYFEHSDVFVFPTYYDCFPLVLLEAMQYSLPIISTFQGGIPSIVIDGKTGFLIPKKNIEVLADAMRKVAADPELRIRMGEASRARYEQLFTVEKFEQSLTRLLKKAVGDKADESNYEID